MYEAYFDEVGLIPEGRFHELAYESLEKDPLGEMRSIYDSLDISGFSDVKPQLEAYLDGLKSYRKSELPEIEPALRQRIATAWSRYFEEWGYQP